MRAVRQGARSPGAQRSLAALLPQRNLRSVARPDGRHDGHQFDLPAGGPRSEIRRVPVRQRRGPGHDRRPAVLYRVRQRHQHRPAPDFVAQLHSRLLPLYRRQGRRSMGPADCHRIEEGTCSSHQLLGIYIHLQIFLKITELLRERTSAF